MERTASGASAKNFLSELQVDVARCSLHDILKNGTLSFARFKDLQTKIYITSSIIQFTLVILHEMTSRSTVDRNLLQLGHGCLELAMEHQHSVGLG